MQKTDYVPISCSYYDELEAWATLKTACTIIYQPPGEAQQLTKGIITNLYTKEKVEYLVLDTGMTLRLDQLISVNGKLLSSYC